MRVLRLAVASFTIVFAVNGFAADLLWPLPGHETLTGGFADSRPDHFHGGVDVRTGPDPLPVIAPADGWIERIAVTPPGYGRALYFRLPDGRTAVFAHLSRFAPALEHMLRDSQLACGTYRVDFSFTESSSARCFTAGDTVAYTGKTGAGPAHFHYEIREGAVQTDPLAVYPRPDTDPPVITGLSWTTLSAFTPWSSGRALSLKRLGAGHWSAPTVRAAEPVAFFLRCYDPGPWGRNAVPKVVRVKVEGRTVFEDFWTHIDLLGPRDIYAKIVWPERLRRRDLRRLFEIPPQSGFRDTLSVHGGWLADLSAAAVQIEVEDRSGNIAQVALTVTAGNDARRAASPLPAALQAGAFTLETEGDPAASWARLTLLSPTEVRIEPAGLAFTRRLRLRHDGDGAARGAFCYERTSGGSLRTVSQAQVESDLSPSCWVLRAGTYGVGVDSLPPELSLFVRGGELRFRLTDDLSGIDDAAVRCTVDDFPAVPEFEYEERGGTVWTPQPLTSGAHEVAFTAADRAGNARTWRLTVNVP
ncbi:MAG: M23 family metallopeptidase [bacterium]|nr:M23 family metallopeptidase [bacterium]